MDLLLNANYRMSPAYECVPLDALAPALRAKLADMARTPEFHAVLITRANPELGAKAVDLGTARLLEALRSPRRLAAALDRQVGAEGLNEALGLVLDGVLEVEWDGRFVSGAAACEAVLGEAPTLDARSHIGRLSVEALRYVESIPVGSPKAIAWRLYRFNTLPASRRRWRRFPTSREAADFVTSALGVSDRDSLRVRGAWLRSKKRRKHAGVDQGGRAHKLYVSPIVDDVPGCVAAVAKLSADTDDFGFKVCGDLAGLLRPDKIMLYFDDLERLEEAAARLTPELAGVRSQGVPFTASLTNDGLLSWGVEPVRESPWPDWPRGRSWRKWVTDRLASAIMVGRGGAAGAASPARFALGRITLDGVNPESWAPVGVVGRELPGDPER